MSILDKLTGRAKKAAGDLADDPSLRREGARRSARVRPRTSSRAHTSAPTKRPQRSRTSSARAASRLIAEGWGDSAPPLYRGPWR